MAFTDEAPPDPSRIEELFHQTAALPEPEQAEFLAQASQGNRRLQSAVSELLAAAREASTAWERSALDIEARHTALESRTRPGEFCGPYCIVRRIGTGGMGSVYEAVRKDAEFHKRVAIKFVHLGIDDPAGMGRFRSERQILAQLEHSGIARLFDGGTTADGIPYLVMEYVDGVPIDRFAAERGLSRIHRLQLWLQVAEAVQYAHRNLVVHRDLKPANIIVSSEGVPKLLDFGIAKLLDSGGDATTLRGLTPEYASPEQVCGRAIGVASDIYSLGVLLFVLLAGRRPYRATAAQPAELVREICEAEPVWEPPGLIDAELRSILSQALRKEPGRRYASVERFADDVRRYIEGLPVSARGDSTLYRVRKFTARHAIPVAASVALILAILGGLSASIWQARRADRQRLIAQRRFDEARRLAYSVIHEIEPKLATINGTVVLRKTLIEQTLGYLERLARDSADSPELMRELIDSYVELAQVAADAGTSNVGDPRGAAQILQKAEVLAQTLARQDGSNSPSARVLVHYYRASARYFGFYGSREIAETYARQALTVAERLAASTPGDFSAQDELASSLTSMADAMSTVEDSADHQNARARIYERSLGIWQEALNREPGKAIYWKKRMALAYKNLSSIWIDTDTPRALEAAMRAREIDQELMEQNPTSPAAQMDLAFDIGAVGGALYKLHEYDKAASIMRENVALREKVAAANPEDRRAADRLAYALRDLGQAETSLGHGAAARRDLLRTAQIYERLSRSGPLNPQSLFRFGQTTYELSEAGDGGQAGARCKWLLKSVELLAEYERRQVTPPGTPDEIAAIRRKAAACVSP